MTHAFTHQDFWPYQKHLGGLHVQTQAELARGLKFVSSGATGFKNLSISGRVAKVHQHGRTERPFGHSDSISLSLEP